MKYGLVVFREGIITYDNLHIERCSRIFTQMSGCSVFFSRNMWFEVVEIKIE
jgi:hypothetical protein